MSEDESGELVSRDIQIGELRVNRVVLFMSVLGLVLVLVGVGEWRRNLSPEPVVEFVDDAMLTEEVIGDVVVDVSGAVDRPGVYRLSEGARVGQAIDAGGGFLEDANADWVARNLNLAAKLTDGMKIYVPFSGEEVEVSSVVNAGLTGIVAGSGVVNVNTADVASLMSLWGIGESRAASIVNNRPFTGLDEFADKAKIPSNVIDANRDKISF